MYVVFAVRPVSEYVVDVEPVLVTMVDHVFPLSVDLSILYPVIAEPPLLLGAVQERLICDDDAAVAVSPVGGCGAEVVLKEVRVAIPLKSFPEVIGGPLLRKFTPKIIDDGGGVVLVKTNCVLAPGAI